MSNYTEKQHLHNYAVWTAARAAQRGFTTTENIGKAIDYAKVKDYKILIEKVDIQSFDEWHKQTCNAIIKSVNNSLKGKTVGKSNKPLECSYGRAAKIVAIYLKTSEVITSPDSELSKIIHPPIDRILLTSLRNQKSGHPKFDPDGEFKTFTWTQAGKESYFSLINHLRTLGFKRFWEIEEYWNV